MNKVELVFNLKKRIYDDNIDSYTKVYNEEYVGSDEQDPYVQAIKYFQTLSSTEKDHILFLLKTVLGDTVAEFLGWLDGSYYLKGQNTNIRLTFEGEDEKLNEDMSDIWFNILEGQSKEDIEEDFL